MKRCSSGFPTFPPPLSSSIPRTSQTRLIVAFAPIEVVDAVTKTANAPVFALLGDFLGHGIVGGILLETESIGEQAGRLAIDSLAGRLELAAPVTEFDTPTQAMFDWVELSRWKRNLAMLPAGSIVINRPPTLWRQYKTAVVAAAIVFLFWRL